MRLQKERFAATEPEEPDETLRSGMQSVKPRSVLGLGDRIDTRDVSRIGTRNAVTLDHGRRPT